MAEENSDFMNKIQSLLNSDSLPENVKEMLGNLNTNTNTDSATSHSSKENAQTNNISEETIANMMNMLKNSNSTKEISSSSSNIDMGTILKMKAIMDKINSKDDPRANLLLSLKPYLNENRKGKVEQYIQLFNMSKIMDIFQSNGGDKKK